MTESVKVVVVPLKLGIITSPPSLVLIYKTVDELTNKTKKRKRRCPLRNFNDKSDIDKYTFTIKQRHTGFLDLVPTITLQKMLRIIQEIEKGEEVDEAVKKVNKEYEISHEKDLNKVSIDELMKTKEKMDETYLKNIIKPDDPAFIYDKRIDFETTPESINHNNKESIENDWDDEESEKNEKKVNQAQAPLEIGFKDRDREKGVERDYKSKPVPAEPSELGPVPKPILDDPFEDGKLTDMDENDGIMNVEFKLQDLDIDQLKDKDDFESKTKKIEIDTLNFDFDDKDIEEDGDDGDDDFWK